MKFEEFSVYYDVVLTGGLNLDNITEIVEFVEPFGLRFKWY
jgi:phosphoribosylanthranilate isomerase